MLTNDATTYVQTSPSAPAGTPQEALGIGIIGAGFMGQVHAKAARAAGAKVRGAVSSGRSSADPAAVVGAEQSYADIQQLLEDPLIDVVHVCVPNHLHAEVTASALQAGKHVVCEKPLAVRSADARFLQEAAQAARRVNTVPFVYRFHPMVRELRHRLGSGQAGSISLINGSYLQDWLALANDTDWRVNPSEGGASRTFADIGSHWCDLLEFVTGDRIAAVSAQFATIRPERLSKDGVRETVRTEDTATVQLRTERGVIGVFSAAQVAAGRKNRLFLEVSGTEKSFAFDQETPEELWVGELGGQRKLVRDPKNLSQEAARYAVLPAGHAQGYQDCFNAFVADTYAQVRGEQVSGLPTFEDGARAARIVDAVLDSACSDGAWTPVPR
jgi:predicted dehydrogenase